MVKQLRELGKSLLAAIVAATIVILFVFETVSVDGTSMYRTLHNNDRLIVEKVTYRFRKPVRGDIVVFKCPSDTSKKFIKRVIAVGGDKIKIDNDKVYVNDRPIDEPYTYYIKPTDNILEDDRIHNFKETTVPSGTIFVLGDNRYDSLDSRFKDEVGFVSDKLIIGKEFLRVYPFNKLGKVR